MCVSEMRLSKFYTSDSIGFLVNRFTIDHTFLLFFPWKLFYPYFSNGFTNNHQFLLFSPYVNGVNRMWFNHRSNVLCMLECTHLFHRGLLRVSSFGWAKNSWSDINDGRIKSSVLTPAEFCLRRLRKVVKPWIFLTF